MDRKRIGVIEGEQGIAQKIGIYFHSPTIFAQEHLFHLTWGAEYVCVPPYRVDRSNLDAFLLFYIMEGTLNFEYRGEMFTAGPDDIVFLDCKPRNVYYATGEIRFMWFHFKGAATQAYCDRLWNEKGALFPKQNAVKRYFAEIVPLHGERVNDDVLSMRIHRLLSLLAVPRNISAPVEQARQLIERRFAESLTVDDLAAAANLSRYHFSRVFQSELGVSPHSYLMRTRLSHAKKLLAETSASIEQIAADCAFCSASNFIRAFRKNVGMTPHKFRGLL